MNHINKLSPIIYPHTIPYDPSLNYYAYVDHMQLPVSPGLLSNGYFINIQPESYSNTRDRQARWILWKERTVHPDQLPLF